MYIEGCPNGHKVKEGNFETDILFIKETNQMQNLMAGCICIRQIHNTQIVGQENYQSLPPFYMVLY